jgi:hypothetical protein
MNLPVFAIVVPPATVTSTNVETFVAAFEVLLKVIPLDRHSRPRSQIPKFSESETIGRRWRYLTAAQVADLP